jgi:hypothetical protein
VTKTPVTHPATHGTRCCIAKRPTDEAEIVVSASSWNGRSVMVPSLAILGHGLFSYYLETLGNNIVLPGSQDSTDSPMAKRRTGTGWRIGAGRGTRTSPVRQSWAIYLTSIGGMLCALPTIPTLSSPVAKLATRPRTMISSGQQLGKSIRQGGIGSAYMICVDWGIRNRRTLLTYGTCPHNSLLARQEITRSGAKGIDDRGVLFSQFSTCFEIRRG